MSASDPALAKFTCGATLCRECVVVPLFSDGWYTQYVIPHDGDKQWHVELGEQMTGGKVRGTIVRCPEHCRFEGESLAAGGRWIDDD